MNATNTINITDVGPVQHLEISVPEEGGVIVLRGRNDIGKSEALSATQALINGQGSLSARHGAVKGSMTGFGATIHVGKKTTRSGNLEVVSLEDRLNIADLVDPGLKDPAGADIKRIKALIALTGAQLNVDRFRNLIGAERLHSLMGAGPFDGLGPLEMATEVKKKLEATARQSEAEATSKSGQASGIRQSLQGVDLHGECDDQVLLKTYTQSIERLSAIEAQIEHADEAREESEKALQNLKELVDGKQIADPQGITLEEARISRDEAEAERDKILEKLAETRRLLGKLQRDLEVADAKASGASAIHACVESMSWTIDRPKNEDLQEARQAVEDAKKAMSGGALIRSSKEKLEAAEAQEAAAEEIAQEALRLRQAAKGIDGVLADHINCDSLTVKDGRLVTVKDGQEVYYSERSAGLRWKIALDIAIDAIGAQGVLVLKQEAWEGLDPVNKREIAEHVKGRYVTVLTAEATNGVLRAETFETTTD